MTPLGDRIAALIAANGPITVADYMALCLGDPEHGYYMAREPFGRGGDFVTAPEVSQIFGELIGLWAVATWEALGSPPRFVLAELGPGRGTLMADLLRAARLRPAFPDAAEIHLVESSPRLRAVQEAALSGVAAAWHATVDSLPPGPIIVIANEFFDALPVRQYARTGSGWAERMVGLDEAGALAFGLRPLPAETQATQPASAHTLWERDRARGLETRDATPSHPAPRADLSHQGRGGPAASQAGQGSILEVSPAATAIMSALASRIAAQCGAALVIDYGYEGPAFGDSLQAVRGHEYAEPLADPGEADLTVHVDFGALARAAADAGARPRPLVTQGAFLARLGIAQRAARLAAGKNAAAQEAIASAVRRLTAPDRMGDLFKVLAVSQSGLALPAFDDDV